MAPRPGAPGTTSPPRRSITSPPTIASPTGSTARSRIAAASASAPGRARACSPSATGSPPAWPAKAIPCSPTPRTATSSTAAAPGAAIRPSTSPRRWADSCRRADPNDPNRKTWTLPQVFSQADEALYYANQFVLRSRDRGKHLGENQPRPGARSIRPCPPTLDPVTAKDIDQPMTDRFGVVYSIGPSPLQAATVWAGTDDGLIHVTRDDGKTWSDVTPPAMTRMEQGFADRGRPFRCGNRLRVGGSPSHRRQQALYLSHARRRQDVAERGRGHPRWRLRQLGEGRPAGQGAALRRHRTARLRFLQRRRRNGSRCRTICRSPRCATSWCMATIWPSPPTAVAFG